MAFLDNLTPEMMQSIGMGLMGQNPMQGVALGIQRGKAMEQAGAATIQGSLM